MINLEAFCADMAGWVNEGRALDVVFSKAFDTLSHQILTGKIRYGLDEWAVRWIKNWANGRAQRVAVRRAAPLEACSQWCSSGSVQDPCMLGKFAEGRKLGGVADTPEGYAAIQPDLDRMENRVRKDLRKSSEGKCRVLHPWRN